jgi:hypothetical protein
MRSPYVAVTLALVLAACAPMPPAGPEAPAARVAVPDPVGTLRLDPAVEKRLLAIDPDNVSAEDVRDTLSKVPAPRVVLLHGGVFPVHLAMTSFAQFLIGMGYPADQIRHPADGAWSHSPYERSERVAGMIAWAYERDGMRPMMVGHSQGGMQVVKVLHDLAGTFAPELPVWDPVSDAAQPRTTIVDPFTRKERPVVGVQASFASAVGAGGPSGVLPNQWAVIGRLREIPDTVVQFNGYFIGIDWFAMSLADAGVDKFRSMSGKVEVRNVILPAGYLHVSIPVSHHLPDNPEFRRFIDAYRATSEKPDESAMPGNYTDNIYYAADNWAAIKKHWVQEAQRLVRARQARAG